MPPITGHIILFSQIQGRVFFVELISRKVILIPAKVENIMQSPNKLIS